MDLHYPRQSLLGARSPPSKPISTCLILIPGRILQEDAKKKGKFLHRSHVRQLRPNGIYRAAKADFLSLTIFEVGLFGWMAIFQIAIIEWGLEMNTVTYWWMMQVYVGCSQKDLVALTYSRWGCFWDTGRLFQSIGG